MTIEQIDFDDIKIQSKYLDLRLRPESIIVTRLFSETLNLPFVVFTIEDDNVVLSPPTKIKVKNNVIYFDAKNLSGSVSLQVNSLLFQAQAYGSRIGFMWPNNKSKCHFADEIYPIDKKFTTTGKFKKQGDDPTSIDISAPVIHMEDNGCMVVHSQLQEPIEFCFFYHNFMPYWNTITNDILKIVFRPCSSRRDGLSEYYIKCGSLEQTTLEEHVSLEQMKRCLYNNRKIAIPNTEMILDKPKQITEMLDDYNIKNCIIGSLAMRLHGFPVNIKDFDIVIDSLDNVRTCLRKTLKTNKDPLEISESQKWSRCGARLNADGFCVDFVELLRFDWNQVEKIRGLNVLSISGLLLMKLIGEYERLQIEPNYDKFQLKNYANIDMLLRNSSFVYPFFDKFLATHSLENYMKLQKQLQETAWDSVPMNINEPLVANVFSKENVTLLPIINNGSEISAKIRIQRRLESAQWLPIGQNPVDCSVKTHCNWSDIIVHKVESLGLLICQNAAKEMN